MSEVLDPKELSYEDGVFLVKLARKAIHEYLAYGRRIKPPENTPKHLVKKGAAFVTLETYLNGRYELRGCIGFIKPIAPLVDTVINSAIAASTEDPRFPPMTLSELSDVTVEVSVLSVPELIKAKGYDIIKEVTIGYHGLIVQLGVFSGILLPVVPVEYCWDVETFLAETCLKAGLSPDCWLSPKVQVFRYYAATFKEVKPEGDVVFRDLIKEYKEKCRWVT